MARTKIRQVVFRPRTMHSHSTFVATLVDTAVRRTPTAYRYRRGVSPAFPSLLLLIHTVAKMCRIIIHIITCKRCREPYGSYRDSIVHCQAAGTSSCRARYRRERVAGGEYCSRECENAARRERQVERDRRRGFPSVMRTGSDRYGRY